MEPIEKTKLLSTKIFFIKLCIVHFIGERMEGAIKQILSILNMDVTIKQRVTYTAMEIGTFLTLYNDKFWHM